MQSATTEKEWEWVRHAALLDAQIVMNKTQELHGHVTKHCLVHQTFLCNCEHGKRLLSHTRPLIKRRRLATHHSVKPPCRTRRIIICDVATVQTRIQTSCAPARPHLEITTTCIPHAMHSALHVATDASVLLQTSLQESKPPDEIGEHPGQTQTPTEQHARTQCLGTIAPKSCCGGEHASPLSNQPSTNNCFENLQTSSTRRFSPSRQPVVIPHAHRITQG